MSFTVGSLVKARGREWVVLPESDEQMLILRPLGGTEDEVTGIYVPLESVARHVSTCLILLNRGIIVRAACCAMLCDSVSAQVQVHFAHLDILPLNRAPINSCLYSWHSSLILCAS